VLMILSYFSLYAPHVYVSVFYYTFNLWLLVSPSIINTKFYLSGGFITSSIFIQLFGIFKQKTDSNLSQTIFRVFH